jgi:hypothetical protein
VCPNRTSVIGYRLKVENPCSGFLCDDTGLNAIGLLCSDDRIITSSQGSNGAWKSWQYCPEGRYMIGFQFRSQENMGVLGDDTAGNDLWMKCSDGTLLTQSGGTTWGTWGNYFECNYGHICGIKTLVETGGLDNSGLNSVVFTCCLN